VTILARQPPGKNHRSLSNGEGIGWEMRREKRASLRMAVLKRGAQQEGKLYFRLEERRQEGEGNGGGGDKGGVIIQEQNVGRRHRSQHRGSCTMQGGTPFIIKRRCCGKKKTEIRYR